MFAVYAVAIQVLLGKQHKLLYTLGDCIQHEESEQIPIVRAGRCWISKPIRYLESQTDIFNIFLPRSFLIGRC